jgi:hypothetical protein
MENASNGTLQRVLRIPRTESGTSGSGGRTSRWVVAFYSAVGSFKSYAATLDQSESSCGRWIPLSFLCQYRTQSPLGHVRGRC